MFVRTASSALPSQLSQLRHNCWRRPIERDRRISAASTARSSERARPGGRSRASIAPRPLRSSQRGSGSHVFRRNGRAADDRRSSRPRLPRVSSATAPRRFQLGRRSPPVRPPPRRHLGQGAGHGFQRGCPLGGGVN